MAVGAWARTMSLAPLVAHNITALVIPLVSGSRIPAHGAAEDVEPALLAACLLVVYARPVCRRIGSALTWALFLAGALFAASGPFLLAWKPPTLSAAVQKLMVGIHDVGQDPLAASVPYLLDCGLTAGAFALAAFNLCQVCTKVRYLLGKGTRLGCQRWLREIRRLGVALLFLASLWRDISAALWSDEWQWQLGRGRSQSGQGRGTCAPAFSCATMYWLGVVFGAWAWIVMSIASKLAHQLRRIRWW